MAIRPAAILPFLRGSNPYALYVLCVLMIVYTLNQKDRFLLGVTGGALVKDLRFGDYACSPNTSHHHNSSSCNGSCVHIRTRKECEGNEYCAWDHTPLGLKYELLAGPLFTFIFSLATIPFGIMASNKWVNRRVMLAIFLALWSSMTLAASFTHRYWQFLLTRLGLGLFEAVCTPFASSIISNYFQEKYRGTALGFYNWGIYLGYSMAFGFNFVLNTPSLGWRWVFIIASLPGFVVALLMLVSVREPARQYQDQSKIVTVQGTSLVKKVLRAYLQPSLIIMCVAGGVRLGAGLVWAYNVKTYFNQLYCEQVDVSVYLTWVPLVGGTLGALFGGLVSDRLARYSGPRGRMWVLIFSQIFAAPFLVGTVYLHSIPWAFISLIPAYVLGEAWLGICLTVAIELVPIEISPASISLFLFISNNISSVMPLLLPLLTDHYDLRRAMLILFPGLYVISATLFCISLCLLIAADMCKKRGDVVKSKSPRHAQQQTPRKRRRRDQVRGSEGRPLLQDTTGRNRSVQESDSSDSDCGDFLEIDEREQKEAQEALDSPAASSTKQGPVAGGASNVAVPPKRHQLVGRGIRGRGRGYGAVECVSDLEPAPIVGSVSEWSMMSPSVEEKRWLAESQEGI